MLKGKHVLITGGTGSFGQEFCKNILKNQDIERLIVYSRDEFKQAQMQENTAFQDRRLRFFLGDVRDSSRLKKAMRGVDYVIHAAALKQVPAAEYNPHEFICTNINGSTNVVDAAIECNVEKVIALSTDKAVSPANLYGATKLCSEKVFVAGNSYSGKNNTRFSVVRYGNVIGSRGSVIPKFLEQVKLGCMTITDVRMTRFLISLQDGVDFVIKSLKEMMGGEIFIPKLPSCKIIDIANAIDPSCEKKVIGIRPGEKLHETLIPSEEAELAYDCGKYFTIMPSMPFWDMGNKLSSGKMCTKNFVYDSNTNSEWLTLEEIKSLFRNDVTNSNEKKCQNAKLEFIAY